MKDIISYTSNALIEPHPGMEIALANDSTDIGKPEEQVKNIQIKKDDRFTTISIDNKYEHLGFMDKNSTTKVRTVIVKDNETNTKETHIKKVFVTTNSNNKKEFIVREIIVDFDIESGSKQVNDRKIHFETSSDDSIENILEQLIQSNNYKELGNTKQIESPLVDAFDA
ncbi:hypothetical protein K6119_17995 [Paracrocinitomix mangrovi]|uniref:hypothetical protein n=1 Tax=Paracrocinitomix mangrovi TaxID=2862509 RepID=UPI001C8E5760|nr:hypothetical protein [Paracrocinitomix mangrovi]UKN01618.1 hypothetical protein K6119_17995 [Paracrocinitomix mangrovi]